MHLCMQLAPKLIGRGDARRRTLNETLEYSNVTYFKLLSSLATPLSSEADETSSE